MPEKTLTICMVSNNYKPYSGGVVSSIQSSTDQLRAQGHRVIIVTLAFTNQPEPEPDVFRIACLARFTYRTNPMAIPFNIKKQLKAIFNEHKPDIVHVHHPFLLGPAALHIAHKLDIPVIFTHHSLYEHYIHYMPFPAFTKKLAAKIIRNAVHTFWSQVDHTIAPTQSIKDDAENCGITTPSSVLPSGILPIFCNQPSRPKKSITNRIIRLLTVSRFVPEKNIYFLIDMFSSLITHFPNSYQFTLAGYGSLSEKLQQYAYLTLGLSCKDIIFVSKPNKSQLLDYYQAADLFIFASQSETQGLVLAEAMSQGTPIIALSGPAISQIVSHGYNGYIISDKHDMIKHITLLAQDNELFARMQNNAYTTATGYHPSLIARQLSEIYQTLIKP